MVSRDTVEINIITTIDEVSKAELDTFQTKVNEVRSQWEITKTIILQELPRALGLINIGIQGIRSLVSLAGGTIPPFFNALLSGVAASAASLMAVATAWTTVPGGQMVYMLANAAIVGINMGVMAALISQMGASEAQLNMMMSNVNRVQSGMGGLLRSVGSGGRMF